MTRTIFILLWCCMVLIRVYGIDIGELLPNDPKTVDGGDVNLTCTLYKNMENITSHQLFLKSDSISFSNNVTILNETSALFTLTNITTSHGLGKPSIIGCYCRRNGHNETLHVAKQFLAVHGYPKVSDVQCVLYYKYDYNTTLVCNWTNYANTDHEWTDTLDFSWTQRRGYKPCAKLVHVSHTSSCTWTKTGFHQFTARGRLGMHLKYVATLIRGRFKHKVTKDVYINITEIVKPYPIDSFTISNKSSSTLDITWDFPSGKYYIDFVLNRKLVYKYRINASTTHYDKISVIVLNTTMATLRGLHPAEKYNVSMEIKPNVKGFWSDPIYNSVTMMEAAPSEAPLISAGSWRQQSATEDGHRTIKFYWQDIDETEMNGQIHSYHVRVNPHVQMEPRAVSAEHHEIDVSGMNVRTSYIVSIRGKNSAGFSPWASWRIASSAPEPPENFTVVILNSTTVQMTWSSAGLDSVTVYWLRCTPNVCQPEWNWNVLSGNSSWFNFNIGSTIELPEYTFGISAEHNGRGSGMIQADGKCVFHSGAVPMKKASTLKVESIEHDSLVLTWVIPECSTLKATVTAVIVRYATSSSTNCQDSDLQQVILGNDEERFPLSHLTPKTDYCLQVALRSQGGVGNYSTFIKATTLDDPFPNMGGIVAGAVVGSVVIAILLLVAVRYIRKGHHFWFHHTLFDSSMVPEIQMPNGPSRSDYTVDPVVVNGELTSQESHDVKCKKTADVSHTMSNGPDMTRKLLKKKKVPTATLR